MAIYRLLIIGLKTLIKKAPTIHAVIVHPDPNMNAPRSPHKMKLILTP
jgi:hypothetical protein